MVAHKDDLPPQQPTGTMEVHGTTAEHGRLTRAEAAKLHIEDPAAYEPTDTNPKGVLIFIGALLVSLILTLILMVWLWGFFTAQRTPAEGGALIKPNQIPLPPRIQPAPLLELRAFRAQEDSILNSYGWVDRKAGIVRIPIARAMDLLAQRGLPARIGTAPVPTAPATGQPTGGPQTGPPVPRFNVPPGAEKSVPLEGLPEKAATEQ